MKSLLYENINIALDSVKSHLLRTILTILIIAFGITALVGILTAIDSIKNSLTSNFASMGSNTFTIRDRGARLHVGKKGHQQEKFERISYDQASRFKEGFKFPVIVSIYSYASRMSTAKFETEKTNPNIGVIGTDENYMETSGNTIERGRNFSTVEVSSGANVVIIGKELSRNLFKKKEEPLDKIISIGANKYRVIGVLKEKGSSMGFSGDKNCILPVNNTRQYFSRPDMSYNISVMVKDPLMLDNALGEATGFFRVIRKLSPGKEDNFDVAKSDRLSQLLFDNIKNVTLAATIIGLITLIGAAIGLMNIMLVSVAERTREIGTRKAIGANSTTIKRQFLIEAIVISQLGGIFGIIFGIFAGNITSFLIGSKFIIPWGWIALGVVLCFIVGVVSGLYPAIRASKLDPIEALRYE